VPDKNKPPKELIGIAAEQGTSAAKHAAAAASEVVSEVLPKDTDGIALAIRVSNKTLIIATAAVSVVATASVVTRIQKERQEKKEKEALKKAEERASWAREHPPVVKPPSAAA
jgi:hypothetical protein